MRDIFGAPGECDISIATHQDPLDDAEGERGLQRVALFMDRHQDVFGAPESGSWQNELKRDHFLQGGETLTFLKGISMFQDARQVAVTDAASLPDVWNSGDALIDALLQRLFSQEEDYAWPSRAFAAAERLDAALTQKPGAEGAYPSPDSATELGLLADHMDAHPERFGRPAKGGWREALAEDRLLDAATCDLVRRAASELKDGLYRLDESARPLLDRLFP